MSRSKCALLIVVLLFPVSVMAQQKAGSLKLKPYSFTNSKGEKRSTEQLDRVGVCALQEHR